MLAKTDLKSIGLLLKLQKEEMLDEVDQKLDKKLEIHSKKILDEVDKKFEFHTKEIIRGIADYIHDTLVPLFDDHEARISKLEHQPHRAPISA